MQRIFVSKTAIQNQTLTLDSGTYHHLMDVCRLTINAQITLIIDEEKEWKVKIINIQENTLKFTIINQCTHSAKRSIKISLIQALAKQDKVTEVCKMGTESGIHEFIPVVTENCDIKQLTSHKENRIKRAILSAAQQSKQTHVPKLQPCLHLPEYLKKIPNAPDILRLYADEATKKVLPNLLLKKSASHIYLAIGPEGGFSDSERILFKKHNFYPFSLGPFIFRTEHAGFAAVNQIDGFLLSPPL